MQLNSNTKTKTYSQKNVISDYQGETNFDVGLAATRLHDTELSCIFYVAGHKKGNFNPKNTYQVQ